MPTLVIAALSAALILVVIYAVRSRARLRTATARATEAELHAQHCAAELGAGEAKVEQERAYREAAIQEVGHLAGVRLAALVAEFQNPTQAVPGLLNQELAGTAIESLCDQVLQVVFASLGDVQIRTDEAAQEIIRIVMGSVRTLAAQAEQLVEKAQGIDGSPDLVEILYQLDHTLVMLRRQAQRAAVAWGDTPGIAREDTSLEHALLTAQSRIAQHQRVVVVNHLSVGEDGSHLGVAAPAAEPLIIALAELLDNGTYFSMGTAPVRAEAYRTATGVAVTISDSGAGLDTVEKQDFVRRMLDSSQRLLLTDVGSPPRLGLAVVGRIAGRVGLSVSLRPSSTRGIEAVLHIDEDLLAWVGDRPRPQGSGAQLQPLTPSSADTRQEGASLPVRPGTPSGIPARQRKSPTPSGASAVLVQLPDPAVVRASYSAMQDGVRRARTAACDTEPTSTRETS
ncbi:ATP-binding protein [Streptomyces sp. NBC_01727]|uniref:ATP-binding protein n=1 Tax=Streptomyces sp. NBC_01727 TaxID=2975924 RepID=UPI002E0D3074|nr:ATP-binding protein [Streptomyces sp. NBC_01727]